MPRTTTRIDRIAGSVFAVRTMSAARSRAQGQRGLGQSSGARSPVG